MTYTGNISSAEYLLCVQFAKDVINSNLDTYANRKQDDFYKVFEDLVIGKVCEFFVFNQLNTSYPDLKVYASKDKSFDADLVKDEFNIHVKSCRYKSNFPVSWVFQPNDELVTSPGKEDVLALCTFDKGDINCVTISAKKVKYGEPIKKGLKKKIIYLKDLKQ